MTDYKYIPLGDTVTVQYFEGENKTDSGLILTEADSKREAEGIVMNIGTQCTENVKQGDKVIFNKSSAICLDEKLGVWCVGTQGLICKVEV